MDSNELEANPEDGFKLPPGAKEVDKRPHGYLVWYCPGYTFTGQESGINGITWVEEPGMSTLICQGYGQVRLTAIKHRTGVYTPQIKDIAPIHFIPMRLGDGITIVGDYNKAGITYKAGVDDVLVFMLEQARTGSISKAWSEFTPDS